MMATKIHRSQKDRNKYWPLSKGPLIQDRIYCAPGP